MRLYWSPEKHAIVTQDGEPVVNISNYEITYDKVPIWEMGSAYPVDTITGRMTVRAEFDVDIWDPPADPTAAINGLLEMERDLDDM